MRFFMAINLAILLIHAQHSYAAGYCQALFSEKNAFEIRNLSGPEVEAAIRRDAVMINAWLPQSLRVTNLTIIANNQVNLFGSQLHESGKGSPFRNDLKMEEVTTRFMRFGTKDFQIHSQSTLAAVFIHEFGHAVLDQHLKVDLNGGRVSNNDTFKKWDKIKDDPEFQSMQKELDQLDAEWEAAWRPDLNAPDLSTAEKKAAYKAAIKAAKNKIQQKQWALNSLLQDKFDLYKPGRTNEIIRQIVSHNEFFADLLVALYFDSKTIMADTLLLPQNGPWKDGRSVNLDGPRPRDFSNLINFKDWKYEPELVGVYVNLDPVRAPLFKLIEKHKIPKSSYPTVIKAVLEAIEKHAAIIMNRNFEENLNAPLINQEFLGLIVESLKKNKLM